MYLPSCGIVAFLLYFSFHEQKFLILVTFFFFFPLRYLYFSIFKEILLNAEVITNFDIVFYLFL